MISLPRRASKCVSPRLRASEADAARFGITPRLRKNYPALPADEEEIAPLEEFERDEGELLRPLGADSGTCVIDEHEVATGQQRAPEIAGIGLVVRPAEHEHRTLDLAEGFVGRAPEDTVGRREHDRADVRLRRQCKPHCGRHRGADLSCSPCGDPASAVIAKTITRRRSANSAWARVGSRWPSRMATIVSPAPASQ